MKYGFHQFRKGDGFYYYDANRYLVRAAAYVYANRYGWKFATRHTPKGVFIERIA